MGHGGRGIVAALAALLLSAPAAAGAASETFNAIFFKPSLGASSYLMLESTQTLHKLQFNVGEIFSYGYRPLQLTQGGSRLSGVIDHLLVSDFVAAFGATEWLQFSLDVPVVLVNQFASPVAVPQPPMKNYINMGDIRVEMKARVLDSCKGFIGLAFVPFITAPTGSSQHYVGDPWLTGGLKIALEGRVHPRVELGFNLGYQGGKKSEINNITLQHQLLLGGGISAYAGSGVGITGEINAKADFSKFFSDRDMNPAEAMVGVNWDIKSSGATLYAGGGTCLTCGVGGARARAVMGVKYRYNPPKFQELDANQGALCRAQFGGMSYAELMRLRDLCPPNPAQYQAGVHDAACPKYYELRDLAGLVLRCPKSAALYRPGVDDPACPKVFDLASLYGADEVMNIYTLAAMEMSMLCPPDAAQYNAQLHDAACPKYYELRNGLPDDVRMAIYELAQQSGIVGGEIQTIRPIYFDFNRSEIRPDMMPLLDQVVSTINANPWIREINIGGHADARGTPEANEIISARRASSVIGYMQAHGVRPGVSFRSVSYGAGHPAASNDTEEGRALNRRVVFTIGGRSYEGGAPSAAPSRASVPQVPPSYAPPPPVVPAASAPPPAVQPAAAPEIAPPAIPGADELPAGKPKTPPSRWN